MARRRKWRGRLDIGFDFVVMVVTLLVIDEAFISLLVLYGV